MTIDVEPVGIEQAVQFAEADVRRAHRRLETLKIARDAEANLASIEALRASAVSKAAAEEREANERRDRATAEAAEAEGVLQEVNAQIEKRRQWGAAQDARLDPAIAEKEAKLAELTTAVEAFKQKFA